MDGNQSEGVFKKWTSNTFCGCLQFHPLPLGKGEHTGATDALFYALSLTSAQGSPWWPGSLWTKHNAGSPLLTRNERTWAGKYTVSNRWGCISGIWNALRFCNTLCQKTRSIYVVPFLPHGLHRPFLSDKPGRWIKCRDLEVLRQCIGRRKHFLLFYFFPFCVLTLTKQCSFCGWGWLNGFIPNNLRKRVLLLPWEFSCFAHSFRRVAGQLWIKMKPEIRSWK